MGAFLDKPRTEKHTERRQGLNLRAAISSMQGWRIEQEDAHVALVPIEGNDQVAWFAVFDGHGGSLMSQESAKRLHGKIDLSSLDTEKLKDSIRTSFLKLDEELRELPQVRRGEDHSGTTAITCLLTPEHIICANCGDSRAIMIRDDKAVELSFDHKPYNDTERERIYGAGGAVSMGRVNGDLAVSRALGDFVYKYVTDLPAEKQQVSPEPEFVVEQRNSSKDQFLVLACDGIWDVMSNEEVSRWVLEKVRGGVDDLGELAEMLIDECLERGSRDNMSAVIVAFENAPRPSKEAIEQHKRRKAEQAQEEKDSDDSDSEPEHKPMPTPTLQTPAVSDQDIAKTAQSDKPSEGESEAKQSGTE